MHELDSFQFHLQLQCSFLHSACAFSLLLPSVSLSLSFSLQPTQRTPLLGCEHWRSVVEFLPVPWFAISADAPAVFPVLMKMGLMNCWEITITCVECFWKPVRVNTDNLIVVLFERHNIQKALVCFTLKTNGPLPSKIGWILSLVTAWACLVEPILGGVRCKGVCCWWLYSFCNQFSLH